MTGTETKGYTGWAIAELMGHVRLAGRVSEEPMFGTALMRIDIPDGDGYTAQYASGGSIYRLTPCSEEVARAVVGSDRPMPIEPWELRRLEAPKPRVVAVQREEELRDVDDGSRLIDVRGCSSCGEDHEDRKTRWLDAATEIFVCPTTAAPASALHVRELVVVSGAHDDAGEGDLA